VTPHRSRRRIALAEADVRDLDAIAQLDDVVRTAPGRMKTATALVGRQSAPRAALAGECLAVLLTSAATDQ
jgi:hypothetical protein